MKSDKHETLILGAGIAVLALSLAIPLVQRMWAEYDLQQVATRAAEVKSQVLSAAVSDKSLGERVGAIVDGISPDAAHAEAVVSTAAAETESPAEGELNANAANPLGSLKVVAEWSARGHARMRVDDAARTKHWTWEAPVPQLASPAR